jgi:sec-independent protein translocase protein TatA
MIGNLTGLHLIVILAVILLIFGAAKLPALAKSVGQSAKILKTEMKSVANDDDGTPAPTEAQRVASSGTSTKL